MIGGSKNMPKSRTVFAVLALICAISAGFLVPASAEFSGCDNKPAHLRSSYHCQSKSSHNTHEFAAQARPRVTIYPRRTHPRPNSLRHCRFWLAKEYRVSGPVVVPQMRCWWD
jgi:hypothetical protein